VKKALRELIAQCPCGAQATSAIVLVLSIDGCEVPLNAPVCDMHVDAKIVRRTLGVLPSHHDITIVRATKFPPASSEVHEASMTVGCPQCGQFFGLDRTIFVLTEHRIEPSFICPGCNLHAWLVFAVKAAEPQILGEINV
jgi:hypothetical protein